jgi:putative membrane protein
MILESLLQYAHILAILTLVVFLTSEAALCRPEWMRPEIVERLAIVDRVYGIAAMAVLGTGLLRIYLGVKGEGWYWSNWLLHTKITLFVLVALLSISPTIRFARWRKQLRATGALPPAEEVKKVRKLVMLQAHIIPFIPLAAAFLARGFGGRG